MIFPIISILFLQPWNVVMSLVKWTLAEAFFNLAKMKIWTEAYYYCMI